MQGADADSAAIFDTFVDDKAKAEHFGGAVAAALQSQAGTTVVGGLGEGVVANVVSSKVLTTIRRPNAAAATKATRITLSAADGMEEELAEFLVQGGDIVKETEPGTLLWFATRIGASTFAIVDTFTDEDARAAHFNGAVAAALKDNSERLVAGGWDNGVLANVSHYDVIASNL